MRIKILVQPEDIISVATFIKSKLGFDHAESVGGTDFPKDNQIEVIYHLGSYSRDESLLTDFSPSLPELIEMMLGYHH